VAGVTALRDTGGVSMAAVRAQSPRLQASGRFLAPPGRYITDWTLPVDGPDLLTAVEQQVGAGSQWVKIVQDWFSPETGRVEPHYDSEVLVTAVAAAHQRGARVAMHCMDTTSVDAALEAQVDSVEHGCNMQAAQLERMATSGTAWCPTITLVSGFMSQEVPDTAYGTRTRRFYAGELFELLPHAAALGVTLLAGSDTIPPADFWREVATLRHYGLPAEAAIGAATTAARAFLGMHDLGAGSPADLVLYDADPRDDPEVLRSPSLVMVGGEVISRR
jgi:imidazolonepropionase-like amidohydrolase